MTDFVKIQAETKNFDAIERALKELPGRIAGRVLQSALRAGTRPIIKAAKNKLAAQNIPKEEQKAVKARNLRRGYHTATVQVGYNKDFFYLGFIERGTKAHPVEAKGNKVLGYKPRSGEWPPWIRKKIEHPGQKSRPWLRPAFDQNQQEAIDAFGVKIWERIAIETDRLKAKK